jgi:predicted MPP superfamily phosphohydrolase
MKIQYFSDLHLEFIPHLHEFISNIKPVCDILVLAGDICTIKHPNFLKFFSWCSLNWVKVFYVVGNHEYYGTAISDLHVKEILNQLPNVSFLNNSVENYGDYLFVGTTLWSHIYDSKIQKISDFTNIPNMTVPLYESLHQESVLFLESTIKNNQDKKLIVITHHLPSFSLIERKYLHFGTTNQFFASSLDKLIQRPVYAWFYGHTHTPASQKINEILVSGNPIGYPGENKTYDFTKTIEL